ncbi:MAG TPA: hypothetical protein VK045_02545 [Ornithinicoccus sp.]|nr:hypothetical protein [Ornithinicoccus sp.]
MAAYPPVYPPFYPESVPLTGTEQRVTVGSTPLSLTPSAVGFPGRRVVVRNTSAAPLCLGGPDVTAGTGYVLAPGEQLDLPLPPGDDLWAVRGSTADVEVHILRLGPR